ncbi:homoserine kinase [Beggiatoa leptomitoformis]|uniref:GHMP kinase N-terminal domain-containing protein n=1 Tax=Beggiatoa leptomitoformis TaxID=288004 RepID=A0A2N9YJ22_9GAMM|nr:hypothetical protein [Beggiatoa leptomitoformis]ALG67564.2 hypothetical protein AL038_07450 [Beggiatoa leptomitoformis]AUI70206.2 hypothetical protein BLE401_16865 [Beggiatoa leptomitoformis]
MSKLIYNKITMIAPAQIANFGGLFDRAGKLCCRPPLGAYDAEGGPGNWMQIERLSGKKGVIEVDILVRKCDADGFWDNPVTFSKLLDEIRQHPEKDVVRLLTQATCHKIAELTDKPIQDGFRITIIIHTPNGQTGLGLGGSASSAAIVIGIDALYGSPIADSNEGQKTLLRLAAEGERIAAGRIFFDNVAPLIVKGDLIYIPPTLTGEPNVFSLNCPPNLHVVTITPDFAISTSHMTAVLKDKTVGWQTAETAGDHKMEVMRALLTQDLNLLLKHATNTIIEPIRGQHIKGYKTAQSVVQEMNANDPENPRYALGISGSGPTMYVMTGSIEEANQAGYEIHKALNEQEQVYSWWFCHSVNPNGAEVIGRESH